MKLKLPLTVIYIVNVLKYSVLIENAAVNASPLAVQLTVIKHLTVVLINIFIGTHKGINYSLHLVSPTPTERSWFII